MDRIKLLEEKVKTLYNEKDPNRADWADWMLENHVLIVADTAGKLAKKYGANEELACAAALLHDIADAKMKREDKDHEKSSLQIARQFMTETNFTENEIDLVVEDAIRYHSCYDDQSPKSLEGKTIATADALAHLQTDLYIYATIKLGQKMELAELKKWVIAKAERDFNNKIFFDDIREEVRPDYIRNKTFHGLTPMVLT